MSKTLPRPAHLTPEYAARFQQQSVVDRYHLRLPHPPELFTVLEALITDGPRHVLDVGTGTGELAREMIRFADRVDALDISPPMIARGRAMPGGDAPTLRWLLGAAETADLDPPYALIVGGDSMHWLDWETAFPRFAQMLTPGGVLAIVDRSEQSPPWHDAMQPIIQRYSNYRRLNGYINELGKRGLFTPQGEHTTPPVMQLQTVEDYVQSWHSRAGLALDTLPAGDAAAFDAAMRDLVTPYAEDGLLTLYTVGWVTWGRPQADRAG